LVGGSYTLFFTSPNFCLKLAFCISEASISCDSNEGEDPRKPRRKRNTQKENPNEKAQQKDRQSGKSDAKLLENELLQMKKNCMRETGIQLMHAGKYSNHLVHKWLQEN